MNPYSLEVFEQEAKDQLSYHESQDYSLYEPRFQQIVKWIGLIHPENVLDICSSWGYFLSYLHKRSPFLTVHGLDSSLTKVDYCRTKGQTIIHADLRVEEPTQVYDVVIFSDNLGYFPDFIEIAQKVAKWGKYTIFTTPIFESGKIQEQLDMGLWKSYIQPDDHYEIGARIGKVVDYCIITCPVYGNKWTCSLVKRVD